MTSEIILEKAARGGILDILSASASISSLNASNVSGPVLASSFFSSIQSNALLVMEACGKGYPVDSYMDVVLALSLQVSLHTYDKLPRDNRREFRLVPLNTLLESFSSSVSRFRGMSHIYLSGEKLKSMVSDFYPEGLPFSMNFSPSTPGERESLRRLSHRVRVVRECIKNEVQALSGSSQSEISVQSSPVMEAVPQPYQGTYSFSPSSGEGKVVLSSENVPAASASPLAPSFNGFSMF